MAATVAAESALAARAKAFLPVLRAGERGVVVFFLYLSVLSWIREAGTAPRIVLPALAAVVCALAAIESARSTAFTRVLRDWLSMGFILAAYWSVGWFAAPPFTDWQERWVGWDRVVLDDWGMRAAIEATGRIVPSVLESTYLFLYAVPPFCVCLLYGLGGRKRVHVFLQMLFLGTLSAYALLPLLPVHGPHVAYPLADLPNIQGAGRGINVWVLDHMDIPTSVLPSGHVAVAYSCAFGMLLAARRRPVLWGGMFALATLVYLATVYCRYHYLVDGLASIALVAAVFLLCKRGEAIA